MLHARVLEVVALLRAVGLGQGDEEAAAPALEPVGPREGLADLSLEVLQQAHVGVALSAAKRRRQTSIGSFQQKKRIFVKAEINLEAFFALKILLERFRGFTCICKV